jgi:outer membrane protein assembly factor BamB
LLRLNINGEIVWSQRLPGDAGRTLEMVGRRAYTTSRTGEDMHALYAWDTIGSFAWMYESIQYPIVGLVEDVSNECIYVQTWTVLYKFSWDGDRVWSRFLPYHERWSETRAPFLGPILGRDGTVWVMDYHDHRYYYVYDQDGARIKGDLRGHGSHPYAACVGRNGRFYVASADNNVTCYENWDEPVWRRRIFDEGEIGDMIMGGDDKIYVCNSYRYTGESYRLEYKWLSLDPDTGGTIHEQIISGATGIALCAGHGLAVGEGGRLIGLHSAGFLTVNSPAPELRSPGYTYTPGGG